MLYDKILELKTELEGSNTDREKEVLENQIDTKMCLGASIQSQIRW